jgi:hypothetical protein
MTLGSASDSGFDCRARLPVSHCQVLRRMEDSRLAPAGARVEVKEYRSGPDPASSFTDAAGGW